MAVTANFQYPSFNCQLEAGVDDRTVALQERTTRFALRVLRLFRSLPNCPESKIVGQQLLRAATSVAANYRAACRAKSGADFVFKLGIVEEEADETVFWLQFLVDSRMVREVRLKDLIEEARQLTAIFVASRETAKRNNRQSAIDNRKLKARMDTQ
jgi:four helix bundle protein